MANKTFAVISAKHEEGGVIFSTTFNPVFIPDEIAIDYIKENRLPVFGKKWKIFSSLDEELRQNLINEIEVTLASQK